MNLSQSQDWQGVCVGCGGGANQAFENGSQIEPTIEAVLDFGQIPIGVLAKVERVINARDHRLELAEHRIDVAKLRMPHRLPAADSLARAFHRLGPSEAHPALRIQRA